MSDTNDDQVERFFIAVDELVERLKDVYDSAGGTALSSDDFFDAYVKLEYEGKGPGVQNIIDSNIHFAESIDPNSEQSTEAHREMTIRSVILRCARIGDAMRTYVHESEDSGWYSLLHIGMALSEFEQHTKKKAPIQDERKFS